ncbi:hypothetical protein GCM10010383_71180 [Streptomyces lomondensis]|uniref:Uncharacterized protein n=2 Tax=Streptomyces lomondensis TaxID=68229 RepID=A0ABQ2XS65_9ACTN|nr:hypothetical protein GCM10010383_71180 [Streptomyces lomondensis]
MTLARSWAAIRFPASGTGVGLRRVPGQLKGDDVPQLLHQLPDAGGGFVAVRRHDGQQRPGALVRGGGHGQHVALLATDEGDGEARHTDVHRAGQPGQFRAGNPVGDAWLTDPAHRRAGAVTREDGQCPVWQRPGEDRGQLLGGAFRRHREYGFRGAEHLRRVRQVTSLHDHKP